MAVKFLHLADLHIGKTVNGFSLLEDQKYVLKQALGFVRTHAPDAVVIAGDVYDKAVPGAQAVQVYDDFLTALVNAGTAVLVVSGNHDSPERLAFAGRIMQKSNVHVYGVYDGTLHTVTLADERGEVDFHLLPYVSKAVVRALHEDEINTTQDAVRVALMHHAVDSSRRNVLVAHQFVVAAGEQPERSDSEVEPVGSLEGVSAALFSAFDYVALGHLHGPQRVGRDAVRYAGSPLKYSFSERYHKKSAVLVELADSVRFELLPFAPLHDMRCIRGPIAELVSPGVAGAGDAEDYLRVTLTDEDEVVDAIAKLRRVYPNVMELAFDNARTRAASSFAEDAALESRTPLELFADFYEEQNGAPPDAEQIKTVEPLLGEGGAL